jgi:ADP-ribose pyrophosphatase YjhB (NUDIX family)
MTGKAGRTVRHDIGEYIANDYIAHGSYLDDEAYAQALDSLVFVCVDIMPVIDGKVLIARRTRHPQADWWIFGGRMKTGETMSVSAHRLVQVEMGLDIAEERFEYLTTWIAAWGMRAQAPQNHGTHNASMTVLWHITPEELEAVKLNDEYSEKKLVPIAELSQEGMYHPALRQCAMALLARGDKGNE